MQKETRLEENGQKRPVAKTRIARFLLPSIDAQSALLPSDRWIVKTVREIFSTNKALRRDLGRMALFSAGAVVIAGAGIAGAVMAGAALLPVATVALVAVAGMTACVHGFRKSFAVLRQNTLPSLRTEILARYTKMKGAEVANEWSRRIEERRVARAAEKVKKEQQAELQKPAEPSEKPSGNAQALGKLGKWALRKALEKAQEQKKQSDAAPEQGQGPVKRQPKTPE